MLRLVETRARTCVPELRRVSLWGLDEELATCIDHRLRRRWPQLLVQHGGEDARLDARPTDLWICGAEPPAIPRVPTRWLGEVERSARVVRIGARLWRCSTPLTGRQLVRSVDEMWRQFR